MRAARIVAELRRAGSPRVRRQMEEQFAIRTEKAFGLRMETMKRVAKEAGRSRELALALWATGIYEARIVAVLVAEPAGMTAALMDRWCRDFDNWAICDTACFHLFDRTPHALGRIRAWSRRRPEFERRAAFALMASVALHDAALPDSSLAALLPLIERAAADERNFVKKGVNWALRAVAIKRPALRPRVVAMAKELAEREESSARWIGLDALREFKRKGWVRGTRG